MPDFPQDHILALKWSEMREYNSPEEIAMLEDYRLPSIHVLKPEVQRLPKQKTRRAILGVLAEGISFGDRPRLAMSALEIHECIGTKLTVIYFHLQKLIDSGHVREIADLSNGRYDTVFYVRTGRTYLYIQNLLSDDSLRYTLSLITPGDQLVSAHMEEYLKQRAEVSRQLSVWFDEQDVKEPEAVYLNLLNLVMAGHPFVELMVKRVSGIFPKAQD